jgi:hypothetical protein
MFVGRELGGEPVQEHLHGVGIRLGQHEGEQLRPKMCRSRHAVCRTAQPVRRGPSNLGRASRPASAGDAGRTEAPMHASHGEDKFATAYPNSDELLRMRTATRDAAFVADGIALGLLLKWAERAPPPSHDRSMRVGAPSPP